MKGLCIIGLCLGVVLGALVSPAGAEWQHIGSGIGSVILGTDTIENATVIYATDQTSGDIYRYDMAQNSWTKIGSPGKKFVVAGMGYLYGLSPDGSGIYRWNGSPDSWTRVGNAAADIFGGPAGFFATDPGTGDIVAFDQVALTWRKVGGPGSSFAVGSSGHLYGLSPDGSGVWKYNFDQGTWDKIGGAAADIFAGGSKLYATNPTSGDIYSYSGSGSSWTLVGGPGAEFAVDTSGQLYGLSPNRNGIYRHDNLPGLPTRWTRIGESAQSIQAGGYYLAYLTSDHELYLYKKPYYNLLIIGPQAWQTSMQKLANHKNALNISTKVHTLESIQGAQNTSQSPQYIKWFIEQEHRLHGVKYVLLAGDIDVVPTMWTYFRIAENWRFSGTYGACDTYFADLYESDGTTYATWDKNGNGFYGETGSDWYNGANADSLDLHMDVVVGRVPASQAAEWERYVDKVIDYELNSYGAAFTQHTLFIAGADFDGASRSQAIIQRLPSYMTSQVLDVNPSGCNSSLLPTDSNINNAFNSGFLMGAYYGHGSGAQVMAIGKMCDGASSSYNPTTQVNSGALHNAGLLPVFLNFACENGQFGPPVPWTFPYLDVNGQMRDYGCDPICFPTPLEPETPAPLQVGYDRDSTAEGFLVTGTGGAIAMVGDYGFGDPSIYDLADTFFSEYLTGEKTLGELWKKAFHKYVDTYDKNNHWTFRHMKGLHLFGDPTLRVGGYEAVP